MLDSKQVIGALIGKTTTAADDKKRTTGLSFQVYQSLKSSVHRELLSKLDLEKVATVRDSRIRGQVLLVIQDLVSNLTVPDEWARKRTIGAGGFERGLWFGTFGTIATRSDDQ